MTRHKQQSKLDKTEKEQLTELYERLHAMPNHHFMWWIDTIRDQYEKKVKQIEIELVTLRHMRTSLNKSDEDFRWSGWDLHGHNRDEEIKRRENTLSIYRGFARTLSLMRRLYASWDFGRISIDTLMNMGFFAKTKSKKSA